MKKESIEIIRISLDSEHVKLVESLRQELEQLFERLYAEKEGNKYE